MVKTKVKIIQNKRLIFFFVWKEFNANDLIYSFYKYILEIYNTLCPFAFSQLCFLQKYNNDSKKFSKIYNV